MRFVIFGAGAIGGVVGARLHQSGHEVMLIARGAHHEAIARRGLTLETPEEVVTLPLPVARSADEAGLSADDTILLTTKSQDAGGALKSLREAHRERLPIVCLQNGVENERKALRLFPDVYGAVVMSPTAHLEPGVVRAYATRVTGAIDIGRYPYGVDDRCAAVCAALRGSRFDSEPREDIMRHKHAKLINNLANAVEAVCGTAADSGELIERLRDEGRRVLRAAGIAFEDEQVTDVEGRWQRWGVAEIDGAPRSGGSTWQSVTRGGRIETDYLNGEIVLRGRQHGVATPLNALMQELANQTARESREPGWLAPQDVLRRVDAR